MTLAQDIIDKESRAMTNNTVMPPEACKECSILERKNRQLEGRVRFAEKALQQIVDLCQAAQIDY